ncbi:MAG: penicillin-binding protein 1C [Candidatus Zixiibacteriota bacterium]
MKQVVRYLLLPLTAVVAIGFGADMVFPLPQEKLYPPSSTLMLDKDGELLRAFLAPDEMWRLRVESDEISPLLKRAVMAYEDRHFERHPGVNPISLIRAGIDNLRAGRVVRGGSTITMQVARLIEPKERTVASKVIEVLRALQLEAHYSKDEILTFYFNLAPYGGNLVGVGAAARVYFDKQPDKLSAGEVALLAAIPKSPNRNRPDVSGSRSTEARNRVLRVMGAEGVIEEEILEQALAETVPQRRFDLPFAAPHLAEYLRARYQSRDRLESTIDQNVQRLAETKLRENIRPLINRGIGNGAIVVIDNRTQAVRAMVGSQEFFADSGAGQVNGALAPRSPGSALKPFVYALAIDQGVVSPKSLLYDVPVDYSGYKPVNYDESFNGAVTVEDALIRSLNVPAINLAAKLGGEGFYNTLKQGGIRTLNKRWSQYGLPIVLGGCEVNLLELTNLYSALAHGGEFHPYRLLESEAETKGKQLMSEAAAFIVTDILSQLRRPELPTVWDAAVNTPKVAWKTGTSLGKRDAWSIGYNEQYTIGVWVGNFDGKGNPSIVGAEVAAPILFSLFDGLAGAEAARWFVRPQTVASRQVCITSGQIATERCAATMDEMYIEGVSPNEPCGMHELILVDRKSGERLCNHCRDGHKYDERIVTKWPTQIATWMARNGFRLDAAPEHNPTCARVGSGDAPVIVSPSDNSEFKIRSEVKLDFQKILLDASVANDTRKIYWFMNRRLIFSGDPSERVFVTPTVGTHRLICMDDVGRSAQVTMTIRQ